MRAHTLHLGLNGQAPGSAYLQQGLTKVVATVYGPRENTRAEGETVSSGVLEVHAQYAAFTPRARSAGGAGGAGALVEAERRLEAALHQALLPSLLLERFPKSVGEVHVRVLEEGGGVLAVAATAASAALVDAGVDIVDVVVAAQVGQVAPGSSSSSSSSSGSAAPASALTAAAASSTVVDPSAAEEAACSGLSTIAYMPSLQRITLAAHSGAVDSQDLLKGLALALDACLALRDALRPPLLALAAGSP